MQRLANKIHELFELVENMTEDDYEHWKQETLQQCSKELKEIMKLLFKAINKYR